MKTRSNMPLFVVECDNVKTLSNSQIDLLRCGDYLVKKDASGEHAYKVTFKSDTGLCLTYHDASVIETQSYDKIDGVWTYNSEDKTPNLLEVGGTKLYKHLIEFTGGQTIPNIVIISFNNSVITTDEFFAFIEENNAITIQLAQTGENLLYDDTNGLLKKLSGNDLELVFEDGDFTTIIDTVTPL